MSALEYVVRFLWAQSFDWWLGTIAHLAMCFVYAIVGVVVCACLGLFNQPKEKP